MPLLAPTHLVLRPWLPAVGHPAAVAGAPGSLGCNSVELCGTAAARQDLSRGLVTVRNRNGLSLRDACSAATPSVSNAHAHPPFFSPRLQVG